MDFPRIFYTASQKLLELVFCFFGDPTLPHFPLFSRFRVLRLFAVYAALYVKKLTGFSFLLARCCCGL
jgi:hypothetical protein